jgi:hypothetical protein
LVVVEQVELLLLFQLEELQAPLQFFQQLHQLVVVKEMDQEVLQTQILLQEMEDLEEEHEMHLLDLETHLQLVHHKVIQVEQVV